MYKFSIIPIKFKYLHKIKIIIYLLNKIYTLEIFLNIKEQIIKTIINIVNVIKPPNLLEIERKIA